MTLQPIQKPVRQRTNPLYLLLLLAILAATAYPHVREYMEEQKAKNTYNPLDLGTSGSIKFKEVRRSINGWEYVSPNPGWEVKAAFYRPLTEYEIGVPGQQVYVLVLQKK